MREAGETEKGRLNVAVVHMVTPLWDPGEKGGGGWLESLAIFRYGAWRGVR